MDQCLHIFRLVFATFYEKSCTFYLSYIINIHPSLFIYFFFLPARVSYIEIYSFFFFSSRTVKSRVFLFLSIRGRYIHVSFGPVCVRVDFPNVNYVKVYRGCTVSEVKSCQQADWWSAQLKSVSVNYNILYDNVDYMPEESWPTKRKK